MIATDIITGHHEHQYLVDTDWGTLDAQKYPVTDCHEMVIDNRNRLYMLTNNTRNNILVYDLDGNLLDAWGTTYPGAHGLSISTENKQQYLFIADYERHQVIKTTLTGKEVMVLDCPFETGCYSSKEEYLPTETAIAPNGDIYVADGYGLQYIIQYNGRGQYIRHWGGRGDDDGQLQVAHGVAIDARVGMQPSLLVTSRNQNCFKRFTLQGKYLETIHLPGSFVCRPVIQGGYLYAAVFRSVHNMNLNSGYLVILDRNNKVVSAPGATTPAYIQNELILNQQPDTIFQHPHDVAVDNKGNIYVCQWKSGQTYPIKLKKIIS